MEKRKTGKLEIRKKLKFPKATAQIQISLLLNSTKLSKTTYNLSSSPSPKIEEARNLLNNLWSNIILIKNSDRNIIHKYKQTHIHTYYHPQEFHRPIFLKKH